jgi:DNA-directed RNA polymerase specialized sigma24 family protein
MSSIGSVTCLLARLKGRDDEAARRLWEAYYGRLVALARARLRGVPRRAIDEEDVALSAFDSFCRAAEAGRFPRLDDRDDLWQVLLMLTARKASDLRERETCAKRGGGRAVNASALDDSAAESPAAADWPGSEPDPAEAAAVAEECRRLLKKLGSEELTQVAVCKLEGFSNAEIGQRLNRSEGTVERKLQLIRAIWQDEEAVRAPASGEG